MKIGDRADMSECFLNFLLRKWYLGIATAIIVALAFALWIDKRDNYHAIALLDIGNYMIISDSLRPRFELIESINSAERFAINVALSDPDSRLREKCQVQGQDTIKPQLMIQCGGESLESAEARVRTIISRILDHHNELHNQYKAHVELRKAHRTSQMQRLDERLEVMRNHVDGEDFDSWYLSDRIFDLEDRRDRLVNEQKIDDFQVLQSRFPASEPAGIKVIDRTLDKSAWVVMAAVSIASGFITMVLLALGDGLRMRVMGRVE